MKRKKAALYDPYLDTLGGGEKHILSICKVFEDNGYDIIIYWDKNLQEKIDSQLNIKLPTLKFCPNIFKNGSFIKKIVELKTFDVFFYVTDGSYFYSPSKKNYIFAMVPKKELYSRSSLNVLKTHNSSFISNSKFTQKSLKTWGIKNTVIYPFIDSDFINLDITSVKKEKIILSVGRFFSHLHSKRHDLSIHMFKNYIKNNPQFNDYSLILAGGLKEEDKEYFEKLKKDANNDPKIIFKPNLSYKELIELYKKSEIYWHFAGYGINDTENPEQVEHFGITPLEAMGSGCITYCYNAGGPKEIIQNSINGFLFNSEEELLEKMRNVQDDTHLKTAIKESAKLFVKNNFTYDVFKHHVEHELIKNI